MAQYTFSYSCGHGEGSISLFGKTADRERQLEWLASTHVCPACYRARKEKENQEMGLVLAISATPFPSSNICLSFIGDTRPVKETIKAMGYRWQDIPGGLLSLFSMKKAPMGWVKICPYETFETEMEAIDKSGLQIERIEERLSVIDMSVIADYAQKEKAAAEAKAAALVALPPKPEKPACYPAGYWNGKIYGEKKYGYRIYVDERERKISAEDMADLFKYQNARAAWLELKKKAEGGV